LDASRKVDFVGQRLLHYQVSERLGTGSLAVVCRGIDLKEKRTVALKFFPESLTATEEARFRFVREMRACSALEHPNIGALYALEETGDGRLFLVMAYYGGRTLAQRLETGPISANETISIALQLLNGLAAAHQRGMVHGDLKPRDLIFNEMGVLKILDFGLAKFHGDPAYVSPGSAPLTVAYMSPEHAAGAPAYRRSDLWSAGVIMYEMITGRLPFQGANSQAVLAAIASPEPVSVAGFPPGLDRIVKKALDKDPEQRYKTADEIIHDLEAEKKKSSPSPAKEEPEAAAPEEASAPAYNSPVYKASSYNAPAYSAPVGRQAEQPPPGSSRRLLIAGLAIALFGVAALVAWFHLRQPATPPSVALALGRVRLLQEKYPEAVAEFQQVLSADPRNNDAFCGLAQAYAAMGLPDKALESWQKAIAFHPNLVEPYNQLAKFEVDRGDYTNAVANFRRALQITPADSAILSNLGAALSYAGSLKDGRQALEDSIRLGPSYNAWNNLGNLDLKQKKFADAARDYAKALEFENSDYRAWLNLAIADSRTPGQKEKAKDAYQHAARMCQEALKANPSDPVVVSDLAMIEASEGEDRKEPLVLIGHALELAPDNSRVQFNAAQTYAALGNAKVARSWVAKLVAAGYPIENIDSSPLLAGLMAGTRAASSQAQPRTQSSTPH
jgi:serine/threonine protein kinase/Tfp pilus assembly protein PilF